MLLTEKRLRKIVREMLLNEGVKPKKIVISTGDVRTFPGGKFEINQYDPVIMQINKFVDEDKKNYAMKVLEQLKMTFIKNKEGKVNPVAAEGDHPYKDISSAYFKYASEYASLGDATKAAEFANMSMIPDITDKDKPSGPKALVRKDPTNPYRGYEIVSTGMKKGADVPTIPFKNAIINGEKVSGEVAISDIFQDLYVNNKVLKNGSGRKWIKGDKSAAAQSEWIQVKVLQGLLISAGYAKGLFDKTDGDFGPKTKKAVENMQRDLKLKVDGKVGQQTASALNPNVSAQNIPITGAGKLKPETLKKLGFKVQAKEVTDEKGKKSYTDVKYLDPELEPKNKKKQKPSG